jgi:glycosyltransferase involved in cell wall biosynthesis
MLKSISMLSTFPPIHCGIATFAQALTHALRSHGTEVHPVALDYDGELSDGSAFRALHRSHSDSRATARALNDADLAIIQHEFGIFGGESGEDVTDIVDRLGVPILTVLHTVPSAPQATQRRVLQRLLDISDAIVVLSYSAARVLRRIFDVRPLSVHVIPHGAVDHWQYRRQTTTSPTPRLLTWGLIGRGKGLDTALQALALMREHQPIPDYVIAGSIHPKVHRVEGDLYRQELRDLAASLGIDDRVHFVDGYLDTARLAELIGSADGYILPYDNDEQVTSGVLVEALAAGGPVIATRFPHARELLANGTGLLVNRRDPQQLADAIGVVISDTARTRVMREASLASSRMFLWQQVAGSYLTLADELTTFDERRLTPRPVIQIPAPVATGTGW